MSTGQPNRSEALTFSKTGRMGDPFIAAGDRAYLIGAQDGSFPDMGQHVPNEMGGIWAHPIKLLDGLWFAVDGEWLSDAVAFTAGTFWNEQRFDGSHGLEVRRRQFAPDGQPAVVVQFRLRSPLERTVSVRLLAHTDLQSVWPAEMQGLDDAQDSAHYEESLGAWIGRDGQHPWFVVVGAANKPCGSESGPAMAEPASTAGQGVSVALDYELLLPADTEVEFDVIVAGSEGDPQVARETFTVVRDDIDGLWQGKRQRCEFWLAQSRLSMPEPSVVAAWDWLKCTLDWLVRDVPGVGRGLGAGADEYVWWFGCDNGFALLACLVLGQHQTAIDTLDLLRELSLKANGDSGRVIHEANSRGFTVGPGNTQETPQFTQTVWQTFQWTGDRAFLERNYDFCLRGVLDWTLRGQCPDGDVLPYGYGITEQLGLNVQCVDTAVHTAEALNALADMAELLGDSATAERSRSLHARVLRRLEDFWIDEAHLYGDMLATPAEISPRLQHWLDRCDLAVGESDLYRPDPEAADDLRRLLVEAESATDQNEKRPWLLSNWIIVAPLVAKLADSTRAERIFDQIERPKFIGQWGMYLGGIDRTQAMSISTGALIEAEMRYGRIEQGLQYMRMLTDTVHLRTPGAISEMSPDYGCFVQAWSAYAVAWPIVAWLFGVQPQAHLRRLELRPNFPSEWDDLRLEQLRVGDTDFDLHWDGSELTVRASQSGWAVICDTVPLRILTDPQ